MSTTSTIVAPPSLTQSCQIIFQGQHLILDAQAALYWQTQDTLIVSDLHLEKGSFLAHAATHPLPLYDTQDTLQRLEQLIDRYQPHRLVALGDSFHDRQAVARMEKQDWQRLDKLIAHVPQWIWVLGNHDPALDSRLAGECCQSILLEDMFLTHEPMESMQPQIIGHYHPKMRHNLAGGHKVTGKCFIVGEQLLLMPAFGTYTGGLTHDHDAITRLFEQQKTRHFLIHQQQVYAVS